MSVWFRARPQQHDLGQVTLPPSFKFLHLEKGDNEVYLAEYSKSSVSPWVQGKNWTNASHYHNPNHHITFPVQQFDLLKCSVLFSSGNLKGHQPVGVKGRNIYVPFHLFPYALLGKIIIFSQIAVSFGPTRPRHLSSMYWRQLRTL